MLYSKNKIALVDCNSFYVSCERLFNPSIIKKPVIVLSSNDGCVISRSTEAKALGIKMGEPYFKVERIVKENDVKIFSTIVDSDPNWAEGWNKRATVLYLMGRYQDSLNDINEVLKRESRHFGALSGQGLVQIKLKNYEKAIKSYQAVQKIYPSIKAAKVMIPQLRKLIKDEVI